MLCLPITASLLADAATDALRVRDVTMTKPSCSYAIRLNSPIDWKRDFNRVDTVLMPKIH